MTHVFRSRLFLATLAAALLAGGCNDTAVAPSNTEGAPLIETFSGTLAVGGERFYSFTTTLQGTISLTLLTVTDGGQPSDARIGLNIGVPIGTGCTGSPSVAAQAGNTPQFSQSYPPGVYCAKVSDQTSALANPVNFVLNIAHPR